MGQVRSMLRVKNAPTRNCSASLEPSTQREQGGDGVGMLVQMRDAKIYMLVDIIIGKETMTQKRFLRAPNEDVIYVAESILSHFLPTFKQWIESDF